MIPTQLRMWRRVREREGTDARRIRLLFFANSLPAGVLVGGVLVLTGGFVGAEGFRNPPPGAFSLGRAGGRIAHVEDASAAMHNPANLMDLKEAEVQFAPTIVYLQADYESIGGATDQSEDPWHVLPNLFASFPVKQDRYALGLSVTMPYGLAAKWEQPLGSPLRYQAPYETSLVTVDVAPVFAARLGSTLTFGFGVDVLWSELDLRQHYPWRAFPGSDGDEPDGDLRFQGDGLYWGANAGVTWEFLPGHRLAATVRTPIEVDYEGDTSIDNITPAAAAFLGVTSSSRFETSIEFPTSLKVGYGVALSDRVRIEANGEWMQFSNFDALRITAGNNAVLLPSTEIRQDWDDTFTAGIAGDWRLAEHWALRAGYQFFESPVPDQTFSPAIPDANQNVVTVGLGWGYKAHALDLGYAYDWYDRREIRNNQNAAFNGDYEITVHMISLAYRFRF